MQRDISNNPTRIIATSNGYAGEVQDIIGWIRVTPNDCRTEREADLALLAAGFIPVSPDLAPF